MSVAQKSTAYSFSNELNRYNIISFGILPRIHHLSIESTVRFIGGPKSIRKKVENVPLFAWLIKPWNQNQANSSSKPGK